jgi:hypothetical protein
MHCLCAQGENAVATKGLVGSGKGGKGRTNDEVNIGDSFYSLHDILDENPGIGCGSVHFPVSCDQGAAWI